MSPTWRRQLASRFVPSARRPFRKPVVRPQILQLEDRTVPSTFSVNSFLDAPDAHPGDGFCDDGLGHCTLRAAVQEADAESDPSTITLPAGTFNLALPQLANPGNPDPSLLTPVAPTTPLALQMHVHLSILLDGQKIVVPANIGVDAGGAQVLHTTDASGTIDVAAPVAGTFTLQDFFTVWTAQPTLPAGSPDPAAPVRDYGQSLLRQLSDGTRQLTMTVNGQASTAFGAQVLHDGDNIVLSASGTGALDITGNLTIIGAGVDTTNMTAQTTVELDSDSAVFRVETGASATFQGLEIINNGFAGDAVGSGIYDLGSVDIGRPVQVIVQTRGCGGEGQTPCAAGSDFWKTNGNLFSDRGLQAVGFRILPEPVSAQLADFIDLSTFDVGPLRDGLARLNQLKAQVSNLSKDDFLSDTCIGFVEHHDEGDCWTLPPNSLGPIPFTDADHCSAFGVPIGTVIGGQCKATFHAATIPLPDSSKPGWRVAQNVIDFLSAITHDLDQIPHLVNSISFLRNPPGLGFDPSVFTDFTHFDFSSFTNALSSLESFFTANNPFFQAFQNLVLDFTTPVGLSVNRTRRQADVDQFVSGWAHWALLDQTENLAQNEPFNWVTYLMDHNAFNNTADGYVAPNQYYSITDQLRLGARYQKDPLHWVNGDVRLCHAEGDNHKGCANDDRFFSAAVQEIAQWLADNPNQFIVLEDEDRVTDNFVPVHDELVNGPIAQYLGPWVFKPSDLQEMGLVNTPSLVSGPVYAFQLGALAYGPTDTLNDYLQDFSTWADSSSLTGVPSPYMVVVTNTDGSQSWGYLGTAGPGYVSVFQDIGRTEPGWNGAAPLDTTGAAVETPAAYQVREAYRWPSRDELLAYGKRVILWSKPKDEDHNGPWIWPDSSVKKVDVKSGNVHNCSSPCQPTPFTSASTTTPGVFVDILEPSGTIVGTPGRRADNAFYGVGEARSLLDSLADTWVGMHDEARVADFMTAKLSDVSMDMLDAKEHTGPHDCAFARSLGQDGAHDCDAGVVDQRIAAAVWSWKPNEPADWNGAPTDQHAALLDATPGGGWESANPAELHHYACGVPREGDPRTWTDGLGTEWRVTQAVGPWAGGGLACLDEFGSGAFVFSVPVSGWGNQALSQLAVQLGFTDVWLNYNDIATHGIWVVQPRPRAVASTAAGIEGAPVAFDGSGSSDSAGRPLTYTWDFGDGGTGTGPRPTYVYAEEGTYRVTFTVDNGLGGASRVVLQVNVTDAALTVTPLSPSPVEGVPLPAGLLVATFTDADPAGTPADYIATVTWGDHQVSPSGLNTVTIRPDPDRPHVFDVLASKPGPYTDEGDQTLTVTVKDRGGAGASASATVHVADFIPVVNLGPDVSLRNGQTLTVSGSFTDPSADTWTAFVNYGDGNQLLPLALTRHAFALSHQYTNLGDHMVTVYVLDDDNVEGKSSFVVHDLLPAQVRSVVVNDGSAQRSMVDSITVTFSTQVDIAAGAFQLVQAYGGTTTAVSGVVSFTTALTADGRTVATLTFAGSGIVGASLADGRYTLTITSGLVTDHLLGAPLDGDGDKLVGGDRVDRFFRLFGDVNGDGKVDTSDRTTFLAAYRARKGMANYAWYFDYDNGGMIDSTDYFQFLRRCQTRLNADGTIAFLP
jgi:PKD repeat protein